MSFKDNCYISHFQINKIYFSKSWEKQSNNAYIREDKTKLLIIMTLMLLSNECNQKGSPKDFDINIIKSKQQ